MESFKCYIMFFWIFVFLTNQRSVFGSIIELNETTVGEVFPPLYALDAWAHCRRPGDVYCSVDAALSSRGNDRLMDLLTEYSKQRLKHYNRTQLHRGVCVSRCAAGPTRELAAAACLNKEMEPYGLQAHVMSVDWCSTVEPQHTTPSAAALGGVLVALVFATCLATLMHQFEHRSPRICGNKYLKALSLKQNWAIITYDRCNPRTDRRMKDIAVLEGLRVTGIQCVVFSHVFLVFVYSYVDNPHYVEKMYDTFAWQAVINSPLLLQGLFAFSGFLQTYSVLLITEKHDLTFIGFIHSIINRWIRLTPVAVFALWFTIAWYPRLGSGPQWAWLVAREAADCSERWWYHVLYVHNYLPLGKFCMGHTWYLAADMQLHVVGMLLLLVTLRHRRVLLGSLATLVLLGALAAGVVTYLWDLTPIVTGQAPEELRTLFATSRILPLLYLPWWMNMAGFFGGMFIACVLYQDQKNGGKLRHSKTFNVMFHLSMPMGNMVVLAGVVFLRDAAPGRLGAALYAAADRTLLALCCNLMLLGCFTRCKSAFRDALEWRGFHVLGRLSYCAFINHFIILRLLMASHTQLNHASIFSMMTLQITVTVLSYLVAVPMCLLLELPPLQLYKALFQVDTRQTEKPKVEDAVPVDTINRSRV